MSSKQREEIFETLKIDEGVKYEIYADHLGYPTFGVGHLVLESDAESGMELGTPISEERVAQCFDADLDLSIAECVALYGDGFNDFPDAAQQVLVNMMFNMGRTRLSKFKGMKYGVNTRDWNMAADEMVDSTWYKQVTKRADRLVERMRNV